VVTIGVIASNLIAGPGDLYRGVFGATEPLDSAVASAPATGIWTDMGGTQEGVTVNIGQEFQELSVDQITDRVESRLTSRSITVGTSIAEPTLENLQWILNGGTVATATGVKTYDPVSGSGATQPSYNALTFDGWGPMVANVAKRRRLIARKILNVEGVEFAYTKDGQTLFPASLQLHYVSASTALFHIVEATS
jgi:hypothetical protein